MNPKFCFFTLINLFLFLGTGLLAQVSDPAFARTLEDLLEHSVPEMSVKDLASTPGNYVLLDVREKREFAVSHIAQARHVGYERFKAKSVAQLSKGTPIVVYCSVGYRSEKIAERLIAMGYTQVYNLYGGIFEWKNQGNPVTNEEGGTEEVHAYDQEWGKWLRKGKKVYH